MAIALKPAKPFRWLGSHGPANDRKGVLHIRWIDGSGTVRVIHPGDLVKKTENLEALGQARVDEFVNNVDENGKPYPMAEYLSSLEKLGLGEVQNISSDATDADREQTEKVVNEAAQRNAAAEAMAAAGVGRDGRNTTKAQPTVGPDLSAPQQSAPEADTFGEPAGPR